jgi:hypothetical protein
MALSPRTRQPYRPVKSFVPLRIFMVKTGLLPLENMTPKSHNLLFIILVQYGIETVT